ncbi:hypothetical protein RHMOL_Rhmol04G0235400 [Rhododendron molle]|uniref:Uncharacterized protein n=1 Tax=Rhododendron molle TaxID=49168 RepID=A0ACC0P637_RHOML|nr:hypothetical protein RHMOL_Rhmol04G0235400 [Rhododendron molle]
MLRCLILTGNSSQSVLDLTLSRPSYLGVLPSSSISTATNSIPWSTWINLSATIPEKCSLG